MEKSDAHACVSSSERRRQSHRYLQQEFGVKRVPVRDRDARGLVMTAKRIEFVGAAKPADWDDTLTGPPGRFSDLA